MAAEGGERSTLVYGACCRILPWRPNKAGISFILCTLLSLLPRLVTKRAFSCVHCSSLCKSTTILTAA